MHGVYQNTRVSLCLCVLSPLLCARCECVCACVCVCVLNPHLPAIAGVVFVVVAAGQVQPLAKMSACCSYTHRHTGTRTHRHSDSKLVCTLTHRHGQGVHAVLCCAMGRRLFCRRRRRRRCCCCCLFTCSYLMAISRNPKLSAGRACCLASRLACCC